MNSDATFVFPKWTNGIRTAAAGAVVFAGLYVAVIVTFGFTPQATNVGYMPQQPIPYSHALHVGTLGLDCRYCHTTVEVSGQASIPPTQTCMNCHASILPESEKLKPLRESYATGNPIPWVRIHDLPDYAYFNHSAHVRRGVGCVSCHGRVDKMEVVYQDQPLSMQWCLDCHRDPEPHLRPLDKVTQMDWAPDEPQATLGAKLRKEHNLNPSQDCSTCHR